MLVYLYYESMLVYLYYESMLVYLYHKQKHVSVLILPTKGAIISRHQHEPYPTINEGYIAPFNCQVSGSIGDVQASVMGLSHN